MDVEAVGHHAVDAEGSPSWWAMAATLSGRQPRGETAVQAVLLDASQRPLRELPLRLQLLIMIVVGSYCGAIGACATVTRVQAGQLRVFAIIVACSVIAVELTRRTGERAGPRGDVHAIWDLPAAVLLPPLYVLLVPVPRLAVMRFRVRREPPRRRACTAAVLGLGYGAASLAFHALVPALGLGAGAGTGGRAMIWALLAAGCGLIRLAVKDALVLAAFRASAPGRRPLPDIAGTEVLIASAAELSLGTLAALAASRSALALLYATPLAISLQRSRRHPQLVAEARTDAKTGLLNDRTWHQEAADEVARSARTGAPLALGIMDLDHFKAVNDRYGHLAGDVVLSAVADALAGLLRPYDLAGRVGGEEFAFLLPNSRAAEAVEIAERLREQVPRALSRMAPAGPVPLRVTVSIGVAAADRDDWDLGRYYSLADQALYAAKESGRDAVWIVSADQPGDLRPRPGSATRAPSARDAPASPAAPEGESPR